MSKRKSKSKTKSPESVSVARNNFDDFMKRVGVKEPFSHLNMELSVEGIRVQWDQVHETVFNEDGSWVQRNTILRTDSSGIYPSGAGHYAHTIKKVLGGEA